ncbi:MAG: (Fe-S)-binding protein [Halobacteriota archaeon]|nr:(Fe-S)-binding protein [Halobacteriota archaeon]
MSLDDYDDIVHRCFRCGYCKFSDDYSLFNCPSYHKYRLETYSPGGRLWLIRAARDNEIDWTHHLSEIMYSCSACNNCVERCVMEIRDHLTDIMVEAKEHLIERSLVPPKIRDFLESVSKNGNPWGELRSRRDQWLSGTEIGHYDPGDEFLFYVGCLGSYDPRCQEAARALGEIFLKGAVSFGVLGGDENCDGNEVKMVGEAGLFQLLAKKNIQMFEELGVKKIVTLSPHSYNALKRYYPDYGGRYEVLHYTELLLDLILGGKLEFSTAFDAKVTFHDPCFLGRWNKIYDQPRQILERIPGLKMVEMNRNRENSVCCGGGAANFYTDFLGGEDSPGSVRIREAVDTGCEILAVACPGCMTMLEDALKVEGLDDKIAVKDISEIVREAL